MEFFHTVMALITMFLEWEGSTSLLLFLILTTLLRMAWLQGRNRKANQVQAGMFHNISHYVEQTCNILEKHTKIEADHTEAVTMEDLAFYKDNL